MPRRNGIDQEAMRIGGMETVILRMAKRRSGVVLRLSSSTSAKRSFLAILDSQKSCLLIARKVRLIAFQKSSIL